MFGSEYLHIVYKICLKIVPFRCRCGNCNTEMLLNAKECYCCRVIVKCVECVEYLDYPGSVDKEVICVTDHPGFPAVCLNRWSLELAADTFKTYDGHRYSQLGTKERYSKFKDICFYKASRSSSTTCLTNILTCRDLKAKIWSLSN